MRRLGHGVLPTLLTPCMHAHACAGGCQRGVRGASAGDHARPNGEGTCEGGGRWQAVRDHQQAKRAGGSCAWVCVLIPGPAFLLLLYLQVRLGAHPRRNQRHRMGRETPDGVPQSAEDVQGGSARTLTCSCAARNSLGRLQRGIPKHAVKAHPLPSLVCIPVQAATEHGARVLVMTCMENRGSQIRPATEIDQARQKLNVLIREYAMKNRGPKGAVLLDLESLMPYRLHDDSAKWFEFDGLHLTTMGYDMLARLLHATLKMEINKQQ
jgi:hypothetical protein